MWIPDPNKLLKVRLQSRGEDVETLWAEVLAEADESGFLVRLGNVPFLHAKPTYEDAILVRPDPDDGFPTWDSGGVAWKGISRTIHEDRRRWSMIVDWAPVDPADNVNAAFRQLDRAAGLLDVATEGMGRVKELWRCYLAVPEALGVATVLEALRITLPSLRIVLVHPD